ncbi:Type 1 glutamine amidotransferase-like domain-containing protein [Streptococcus oralis]|nr:Type 1 glutamine amidotransferase-like domain-containing protein [Streptococcus oralis]MBW8203459.1 Type 1 glutamine amidotransferase-like domain-containing protein [Streptococcus oralis]
MKQLFLCSYFAGVKKLFSDYAKEKNLENKVLFIPTAGNEEDHTAYIDEAQQTFRDLGFEIEVLDIASCDRETAQAKIFQSKILYISGGNTFYLLQELKKKQLLSLIKEQIRDGLVYVGESAGAIITAKDIDYNKLMDDKTVATELSDTAGLDEVDFYILPHYGEEPFTDSSQKTFETYKKQLELRPLHNHQAIIVNDEQIDILTIE